MLEEHYLVECFLLYSEGDISVLFLKTSEKPESEPKPEEKQASDTEKPFASSVRA